MPGYQRYSYHAGHHVRIGLDRTFNYLGNPFMTLALGRTLVGREREQCDMLMSLLNWTYEYVYYDNDSSFSYLDTDNPNNSSGMKKVFPLFSQRPIHSY
jgi:hypothetical protein